MLIVLTTTSDLTEAEVLAHKIVESKLAACVQVMAPMRSIYFWNGKIQDDTEHLLLIKTLPERFLQLQKFILANHSYETPEIAAIKAEHVSEHYAKWLANYLT
jgi:periplasmic divalent cation tolerance protein